MAGVGTRFFVDETKAKGYVVVAVACPEHAQRERALEAVVDIAARVRRSSMVLDLDPTVMRRDNQVLIEAVRRYPAAMIEYSHAALAFEPLLALPDVVAWCWARTRR